MSLGNLGEVTDFYHPIIVGFVTYFLQRNTLELMKRYRVND